MYHNIVKSDIIYNKLFTKENIIKYLKKKKLDDINIINNYYLLKNSIPYFNIKSNKQIRSILKLSRNIKYYDILSSTNLYYILFYFIPNNSSIKYIENNNFENMNDNEIYYFLKDIYENSNKKNFYKSYYSDRKILDIFFINNIKKYIIKNIKDICNTKIIDIGCGNGKK